MKRTTKIHIAGHKGMMNVLKGENVVKVDPRYFMPTELDLLIGNPTKAHAKLKWRPEYDLDMLINEMELFKRDISLNDAGHKVFKKAV
jgi:GDPmannose 4,6-dehydratase